MLVPKPDRVGGTTLGPDGADHHADHKRGKTAPTRNDQDAGGRKLPFAGRDQRPASGRALPMTDTQDRFMLIDR
jgi:hypothetical protein